MSIGALWRSLQPIGRRRAHRRLPALRLDADEERACREWFVEQALDRGLDRGDRPQRQPVGLVG